MNIIKSLRKNVPEFQALISGRMPTFIYGKKAFSDIPIFCYHEADPIELESHLKFIVENGYRTLTGDEYYSRVTDPKYVNDGKDILLTFDDGLASVWTVGFPLFQRYKVKIVLFVLPGLIEEGDGVGKTIDDVCDSEAYQYIVHRDQSSEPLCNWQELKTMHESGYVDIQSHSMKHSLVSVSPKLVDFIHPAFDTNTYGNVHIPEYLNEAQQFSRKKVLGHPVYESRPRLYNSRRYKDDYTIRKHCEDFVIAEGGVAFFETDNWRGKLQSVYRESANRTLSYETEQDRYDEMLYEIKQSKIEIEKRLQNKEVKHFCFPWFLVSEESAKMAFEVGYKCIYVGVVPGFKIYNTDDIPYIARRLQKEYLTNLPGKGHINLLQVILKKISKK